MGQEYHFEEAPQAAIVEHPSEKEEAWGEFSTKTPTLTEIIETLAEHVEALKELLGAIPLYTDERRPKSFAHTFSAVGKRLVDIVGENLPDYLLDLTPREREMFSLRIVEGHDRNETALRMEINSATVSIMEADAWQRTHHYVRRMILMDSDSVQALKKRLEETIAVTEHPLETEQDRAQLSMDFRRHGERIRALEMLGQEMQGKRHLGEKPEERSRIWSEVASNFVSLIGDRLPRFLETLTPRQQEMFKLRGQDGLTRKECSIAMGIHINAVSEKENVIIRYAAGFVYREIGRLKKDELEIP